MPKGVSVSAESSIYDLMIGYRPSIRFGWIAILVFVATFLPCLAAMRVFSSPTLHLPNTNSSLENWTDNVTWCVAFLIPQWSLGLLRGPRAARTIVWEFLLAWVPNTVSIAFGLACSNYIATIEGSEIENKHLILLVTMIYSCISWSAVIHVTGHLFAPSIVYKAPGGGLIAHCTID